jgi:hypothetical protein
MLVIKERPNYSCYPPSQDAQYNNNQANYDVSSKQSWKTSKEKSGPTKPVKPRLSDSSGWMLHHDFCCHY